MSNQKRLFWFDSETSGTLPFHGYQVLSVAIEVEDAKKGIIDSLSFNVKLKNGSKVDKGALSVNNIDPYSESFNNEAFSYKEAYLKIKNFILKNYDSNYINIGVAYKAKFDIDFLELMFNQNNDYFCCLFDKIICPYSLTKKMTKSNKIETRQKCNEDGTWYRMSSLLEVAKTLNTKSDSDISHTALGDVKIMNKTIKKVWSIAYNQSIFDNQDLKRFNELQVYPQLKGK
jgi:hypothetical protein